mmetsp:Transcript_24149/g.48002  ORF Transcript_24149/g.48002 Transcript_24149/m.48002 type:complete len:943 (-) Transcript_24149:202-3030(-)
MKRTGTKIALAVVATANLSGAQLHQQRRLRRLQNENNDSGMNDLVVDRPNLEEIPDMMETQFQLDSSLSYNLDGGVDISSTLPILPHEDDQSIAVTSHSDQEHMQVHISASSDDVESDTDVLVPDNEADATIRESHNETHHSAGRENYQILKRNGKTSKSAGVKSSKSTNHWNADNHSGKPSHVPTTHSSSNEWSYNGGHSGKGKSAKSSQSPTSKHASEPAPSHNWNWNSNGKATKLFKSKSSGWWPPHPNPSKMPTTTIPTVPTTPTTPTAPPSPYPPLVWKGVNGCTPESPCGVCTGDCDSNEGCMPGLECLKRSGSEQVPGCTSGGIGDIPGADYCYDPSVPPPISPTASPISPTPSPSEGSLPVLEWKGVNGCTPTSPCDVCQGDCDENEDCLGRFECFKRSDGEYTQVPGCAVGGNGDISGADYCYDPNPPSASPTKEPTGNFPTFPPATNPPETGAPTRASLEAFFLQSQAKSSADTIVSLTRARASDGSRNLQQGSSQNGWCAGGALAPDYYQLLLEECKPNPSSNSSSIPIGKVEQMDQLWSMDPDGYIRSIFNSERCMMVSSSAVQFESPIEIGPCNLDGVLNEFYYESSSFPYTLKLQGEAYASLCVTFLGNEPSRGAEMVLGPCENEAKFGWDFIPEASLGKPTMSPTTSSMPKLRYLGRDACTVNSPCDACYGDCDTNEDCNNGLQCFQRDRGDSTQVPGCAIGGVGDIPGADYCYEGNGPTPSTSPTPPSTLPPLQWRGSNGCSVETPCPICVGDCNTDDDCQNSFSCFKRDSGDDAPVPGCAVGGLGDIPGGDYCYDPNQITNSESSPDKNSQPGFAPTNAQGNFSPPRPTPQTTNGFASSNNVMQTNPATSPIQSNNSPANKQTESTPTVQTANGTPTIPTEPDINLNDDTKSSPGSTTQTSTQNQIPTGSKSSKASPHKKISTNQ